MTKQPFPLKHTTTVNAGGRYRILVGGRVGLRTQGGGWCKGEAEMRQTGKKSRTLNFLLHVILFFKKKQKVKKKTHLKDLKLR